MDDAPEKLGNNGSAVAHKVWGSDENRLMKSISNAKKQVEPKQAKGI
ncbi:hypothetical protein SAMN05216323_11071 [Williamwhitmania taraxaci]|uniref:Uncharacterized protein n=1 Tax=Williamwhitmania taraxaci TaxID=1640674 RepID=A0A1G6Q5S5_9BACT|nr:hypothetical protein SAMN05216323_105729 [Williamwhitmania taraxaci]SDD22036.1 hypothetical protein SAMN05216323_11071 [Williamwhitmania taraxaci]